MVAPATGAGGASADLREDPARPGPQPQRRAMAWCRPPRSRQPRVHLWGNRSSEQRLGSGGDVGHGVTKVVRSDEGRRESS